MRLLFLLLIITGFNCATAQKSDKMLEAFKKKNIEYIINNCYFPFNLEAGSTQDDSKIGSKILLEKKLRKLFKEEYFSDMLKGKKTKHTTLEIIIESRSFNKEGELESESTISFYFKKMKNGDILLYSILLAG
jgi:hypothetical protein